MTSIFQAIDSNGHVVDNVFRPSTTTKIATAGTAGPYSNNDVVRVVADGDAWIVFQSTTAGTACDSDTFIPADHVEYFKIDGGYTYIAGTANNVYCTLMV